MSNLKSNKDYRKFITEIKQNIKSSQIKAAVSVNCELLKLYWYIGNQIATKQKNAKWGDGFLKQLSKDLSSEFPEMKGFSYRNIRAIKQWYLFWNQQNAIWQQAVAKIENTPIFQIPWGHNLVIISKSASHKEALFYIDKTIENNWSRAVLVHQIETGLYNRQSKAISNFENRLPKPQSDLAKQTLKDPYCFDFLSFTEKYNEKELEDALTDNISKFLLELGAGFAYVGKQVNIEVGKQDFYIDLLFYHIKLHAYIVIELKTTPFKPEYAGQLNFYVSSVDEMFAGKDDKPTIGLLICKSKNKTVVEYALRGINSPLGVSEYELTKQLPEQFKSNLPTIEDIEAELNKLKEAVK
jgi:predicted nuclease of restriction endonuclease-like (RecB) superfamily